jgi:pilus assembly protein FimV
LEPVSDSDRVAHEAEAFNAIANAPTDVEAALEEIDIYIAYGRANAAFDLVKNLANEYPSNNEVRLKVMEVAAMVGSVAGLENVIADLNAETDPSVATRWDVLRQSNGMLRQLGQTETEEEEIDLDLDDAILEEADSTEVEVDKHLDWDIGLDVAEDAPGNVDLDIDNSDIQLPDEEAVSASETIESSAMAMAENGLDDAFDLDKLALDESDFDDLESELFAKGEEEVADLDDLDFDALDSDAHADSDEDLDLSLDESLAAESADDDELAQEDLDGFDLDMSSELGDLGEELDLDAELEGLSLDDDLDSLSLDDGDIEHAFSEEDIVALEDGEDASIDDIISSSLPDDEDNDDEHWLGEADNVSIKLDLARAYVEMGDAESAIDILDEIIRDGSAEQKEEALTLKEKLS